jgi:sulfatase modifying factor 1
MSMNLLRGLATIPVVALLLAHLALPNAHAVTIDWVTVGDPDNAPDPATGNQYGAVAKQYRIMKFEFTNSQYAAFLNAIDPDGTNPNSVYNVSMGSDARGGITNTGTTNGSRYAAKPNMGDKPVNFVSWWDAARVCNWLHNGAKTYGSTDSSASAPQNIGAYTVGTATSGDAVAVNPGALFYVPTANEWHKAAYYDPTLNGNAGGYHVYGNGFDTTPGIASADASGVGSAGGVGNFANYHSGADWNGQDGNVTTVGTNGGASYYGAFDMSGNVYEWTDLTGAAGSTRELRNGGWINSAGPVSSSNRNVFDPAREGNSGGFRLASPVP